MEKAERDKFGNRKWSEVGLEGSVSPFFEATKVDERENSGEQRTVSRKRVSVSEFAFQTTFFRVPTRRTRRTVGSGTTSPERYPGPSSVNLISNSTTCPLSAVALGVFYMGKPLHPF